MPQLGIPELIVLLTGLVFGLAPLVIGIWAVITLVQVRRRQDDVLRKLESLERVLGARG